MLKKEVRVIAWDDCAFSFGQKNVRIVGVVFRGGQFLDGLVSASIAKDGLDATEIIAMAIKNTRHHDQLSYIMLDGITFAGFNMVDIKKLHRATKMPVIAVQREAPDMKKFFVAMKRVSNYGKREKMVKNAGTLYKFKEIFYQKAGLTNEECEQLLALTCVRSKVPEPIRVAHLIASGLSRVAKRKAGNAFRVYESRGRA